MLAVAAVGRPLVVLGELTVLAWLWATLVVATSAGVGGGGCQSQRSNFQGTPRALHMHARDVYSCSPAARCLVCARVCACCRRCLVTVGGDGNGSQ